MPHFCFFFGCCASREALHEEDKKARQGFAQANNGIFRRFSCRSQSAWTERRLEPAAGPLVAGLGRRKHLFGAVSNSIYRQQHVRYCYSAEVA